MIDWTPEQLAVKQFNKMLPTLNSFARSLTGTANVSVAIGDATYTDGKKIFISLPREMTKPVQHVRTLCDQYTDAGAPMCEACANQEIIFGRLFHEIGHHASGSFKEYTRAEATSIVGEVYEKLGLRKVPTIPGGATPTDVLKRASWLNPFLPGLIRVLEDARVNRAIMKERAGAGGMIVRDAEAVLEGKAYQADGTKIAPWSERELNMQMLIAPLCLTMGISIETLDPLVQRVANKLADIAEASADSSSVGEVFAYSLAFLSKAQEYGFFLTDNDAENFSEGDGEDGEESPAEESSESEGSAAGGDGESEGAGENQPADEKSDSSDDGSGSDSSKSEPGDSDDSEVSDGDSGSTEAPESPDGSGDDSAPTGGDDSGDDGAGADPDCSVGPDREAEGGERADGSAVNGDDTGSDGGESSGGGVDGEDSNADAREGEHGSDPVDTGSASLEVTEGTRAEEVGERTGERVYAPEDFGTADDANEAVDSLLGHGADTAHIDDSDGGDAKVDALIRRAVSVVEHFDQPSRVLHKVEVTRAKTPTGSVESFIAKMPSEVLAPSLMRLRRAFDDNKRVGHERNKRSGRVSSRVLGRRAWSGDDRLFTKKSIPAKRDYAVLIGIDISGSTSHQGVLALLKKSVYIQAELCSRLGVKFAVYAHSGQRDSLIIRSVKTFEEPWSKSAIARLAGLRPVAANLDGHTMEFYRKRLQEVQATDKILMYYSDGAMPLENFTEELAIIKREIKTCRQLGIELMSVGIGSDDPADHGLDNVRIDSSSEIIKVAKHLEKRLVV